ncbi:MAG: DUF2281 domain-containing protein [Magnetococcus sp. THC-1_WYH]
MPLVDVQEANGHLVELIKKALSGEDVILPEGDKPLARLVPLTARKPSRQPGSAKGDILYIAPDFDAPLEDFKDYM